MATEGTPIDIEKMRSIGVISKRTKPDITEGKKHSDSGLPYKSTTDESGTTITEHGARKSGVSERQDVHVRPSIVDGVTVAGLTIGDK